MKIELRRSSLVAILDSLKTMENSREQGSYGDWQYSSVRMEIEKVLYPEDKVEIVCSEDVPLSEDYY